MATEYQGLESKLENYPEAESLEIQVSNEPSVGQVLGYMALDYSKKSVAGSVKVALGLAKWVGKLPKRYVMGFLPEKEQLKRSGDSKEVRYNTITNSALEPILTTLGSLALFGDWKYSTKVGIVSLAINFSRLLNTVLDNVNQGHPIITIPYHLFKSKNAIYDSIKSIPNFTKDLAIESVEYVSDTSKRFISQKVEELKEKNNQELTKGSLALPPPKEEGQLSYLESKMGAVSYEKDDN